MPSSLNESLASSQPSNGDMDSPSAQKPKPIPGITYAGQDKLPKLPIPELEDTCKRYLDALRPLQSYREQKETEAAVQEFLKRDGRVLQDKLKKYATDKSSYIEQFCKWRHHLGRWI